MLLAAGQWEKAPSQARSAYLTVAGLGLIGGALLVGCITAYVLGGQTRNQAYLAYLFLGAAAPLLAASLLFMARQRPRLLARLAPALRLFLSLVLAGTFMLAGFEYTKGRLLSTSWPFLAVVLGGALATVLLSLPLPRLLRVWPRRPRRLAYLSDPARRTAVSGLLDAMLIGLLVTFTVLYSRFNPAGEPDVYGYLYNPGGHPGAPFPSDLAYYTWEIPDWTFWLAGGFAFTCLALWLWRVQEQASSRNRQLLDRLALVGASLFVLGLFDDALYVNVPHYMVYVGPAMQALHGGIAMVDVYSIYGLLPWVVVEVAFGLLAPTFGTAALVVRLAELALLISTILVLCAVSRRRLGALSLMLPAVLVAITFHPWVLNLGAIPSTTGMRYLLPTLMVLILVAVRSPGRSRWLGAGLVAVASLWSAETFAYTMAPWGFVLLLQAIRERSLRKAGLTLLIGIAGVVAAHSALALGTFVVTGKTIDYVPYFAQFLRFRPDAESTGWWQIPFDPNFQVWVPIWLGHFLVLSAAAYRALRGRPPTDMASRLTPVAVYGYITLNYYMGQPTWPSLGVAFLPVAIELICGLEVLAINPRRYGTIGMAALLALVVVSSAMIAFGTERFARPMESFVGNSSVLRRCLTPDGCRLAKIPERLKRSVAAAPLDRSGPVSVYFHETNPKFSTLPPKDDVEVGWKKIGEAVDILNRWTPDQRRVALLPDNLKNPYVSMLVLMQTGQWFRWPISSPLNDEIAEPLVDLILRRVAEDPMRDGEILVVSNERDQLLSIEQKILGLVTARCRLALLEKREFYSAFRTEACGAATGSTVKTSG